MVVAKSFFLFPCGGLLGMKIPSKKETQENFLISKRKMLTINLNLFSHALYIRFHILSRLTSAYVLRGQGHNQSVRLRWGLTMRRGSPAGWICTIKNDAKSQVINSKKLFLVAYKSGV